MDTQRFSMKPKSNLEDLPLTLHNEVARREREKLDKMQSDAARIAMQAVAKAFPTAPPVDEVLRAAQKGVK